MTIFTLLTNTLLLALMLGVSSVFGIGLSIVLRVLRNDRLVKQYRKEFCMSDFYLWNVHHLGEARMEESCMKEITNKLGYNPAELVKFLESVRPTAKIVQTVLTMVTVVIFFII